jgi:hypothetical protein
LSLQPRDLSPDCFGFRFDLVQLSIESFDSAFQVVTGQSMEYLQQD